MNIMKQKSLFRKGTVLSIVIVLISIALAPSIYANIDQKSNSVEVTVEVIGDLRLKPITIKITREQAEDLDRLFDTVQEQLNNVESKQEVIEIFNNAIIKLDEIGLLPDKTNARQVQRIITSRFSTHNIKTNSHTDNNDVFNAFCLVAGDTDTTYFEGITARIFEVLALSSLHFFMI